MRNEFGSNRPNISRSGVEATVKWYNPTKGFGFVQLEDGDGDAFLHASVLGRAGLETIDQGAKITCDVADGQRGLQVAAISHVEPGDPSDFQQGGFGGGGGGHRGGGYGGHREREPLEEVEGTVKFFNAAKGYGFVSPDDGGKDVFVSVRTLKRQGLETLDTDQRVRLFCRQGDRGPMAERVELV